MSARLISCIGWQPTAVSSETSASVNGRHLSIVTVCSPKPIWPPYQVSLLVAALDHGLVVASWHRGEGDVVADELAPLHHHHRQQRRVSPCIKHNSCRRQGSSIWQSSLLSFLFAKKLMARNHRTFNTKVTTGYIRSSLIMMLYLSSKLGDIHKHWLLELMLKLQYAVIEK